MLKGDRPFINAFLSAHNRRAKPLESLLRQSHHAGAPEVGYLLRNQQYIELDVSYHGAPQAVAWVEGQAIYCAPTRARLHEIEALGESEEAWTIRQFFLDNALQHLSRPEDGMSDGKVRFEEFRLLVEDASKRYTSAQRPKFLDWVRRAIASMDAAPTSGGSGGGERSAALPAIERSPTIDARIAFLRSFLTPAS